MNERREEVRPSGPRQTQGHGQEDAEEGRQEEVGAGWPAAIPRSPLRPHGILCHYFHGGRYAPTQGSLSADDFERGLDAYGDRIIGANLWTHPSVSSAFTDEVCVTFDDGLREQIEIALPVLERRHIKAAFNVYTQTAIGVPHSLETFRWVRNQFATMDAFYKAVDAVHGPRWWPPDYLKDRAYLSDRDRAFRYLRDKILTAESYERLMERVMRTHGLTSPITLDHWLSASDLRALRKAGHVVGAHSHSHPTTMAPLSREQQAVEYATSRWILERLLGEPVTTMSSPCGSITEYGKEWMLDHGITLCWGATMAGALPYEAPRWSTGYWGTR